MLAILIIAAISVQAVFVQAQYNVVYIWGDPHINSVKKGYETCSYASPTIVNSFFHPRINIRSGFSEWIPGNAHPTVQTNFQIEFKRQGFTSRLYEGYNSQFGLSTTFTNGNTLVPGWLKIWHLSSSVVVIIDYNTASAVLVTRWAWANLYNLFLFASPSYLARGGGLLYEGCPYPSVNPWLAPYNGNPNILGRKKRQAEDCGILREMGVDGFVRQFGDGISGDILEKICKIDSEFMKDAPEQMKATVEALKQTQELLDRELPEGRPRCDTMDEEAWKRLDEEEKN